MALNVGKLVAILGLDKAKFDSDVKSSGDALEKIGKVGLLAGAAVGTAVLGIGAALFKVGSDFDDAYDTIRVGTGATGKALEDLKGSAKNVLGSIPTDIESAGTAIADVNTRLGLTGKPLETVAKQFLEVSRITGTDLTSNMEAGSHALQQFKVPSDQMSSSLDHLFKVSQSTGIGFGELASLMQQNGSVLQQLGYNFDQSASLVGVLDKAGVNVQETLAGMGRGLATLAKSGEAPKDTFHRLVNEIANGKDPIEASQKAIELFGSRSGAKMAAELRAGRLSIDDFNAGIEGNSETILKAAADTNDWKEKLTILKNKVLVAIEPVASKVFNAVGDAVAKATPYVMDLVHWLTDKFLPAAGDIASVVAGTLFSAFQKVAGFIGDKVIPTLISIGKWLIDHKPILLGVAVAIGTVLVASFVSWAAAAAASAIATIAAMAPLLAIAAVVGAVAAAFVWAYNNVGWFHDAVDAVGRFLKNTLWPIIQDVAGVIADVLVGAVKIAIAIFGALVTGVTTAAKWIGARVADIVGFVISIPGRIAGVVSTMWNGITSAFSFVVSWISGKVDWVVNLFGGIGDRISSVIGGIASLVTAPFRAAFNGIANLWNRTIGRISFSIPDWVPLVGGKKFDVPDIPTFHKGGVIPGMGDVPMIGKGGERVLTQATDAQLGRMMRDVSRAVTTSGVGGPSVSVTVPVTISGPVLGQGLERIVVDAVNRGAQQGLRIAQSAVRT